MATRMVLPRLLMRPLLVVLCLARRSGALVAPRTTTPARTRPRLEMAARIGWKQVFIAEYAGPLAIFPATVWLSGGDLAGEAVVPTALWTAHFAKRLVETCRVHRFSKATMPFANLFKNCGYYWTFAAVVGWDIGRLGSSSSLRVRWPCVALFALAEAANLHCHLHLASLRPDPGARDVKVPTSWPFKLVTSPNYTFEILAWVAFAAAFRSPAAALFAAVGALQMALWSRQKLQRYRRKFVGDANFTAKHALVPFVF